MTPWHPSAAGMTLHSQTFIASISKNSQTSKICSNEPKQRAFETCIMSKL